jgi:hypothetical protein
LRYAFWDNVIRLVAAPDKPTSVQVRDAITPVVERWQIKYIKKQFAKNAKVKFYRDMYNATKGYWTAVHNNPDELAILNGLLTSFGQIYIAKPGTYFTIHPDPLRMWQRVGRMISGHVAGARKSKGDKSDLIGDDQPALTKEVIGWLNTNVLIGARPGERIDGTDAKFISSIKLLVSDLRPSLRQLTYGPNLNAELQHGPNETTFIVKKPGFVSNVATANRRSWKFDNINWMDNEIELINLPENTRTTRQAKMRLWKLFRSGPYMHAAQYALRSKYKRFFGRSKKIGRSDVINNYLTRRHVELQQKNGKKIVRFAATAHTTQQQLSPGVGTVFVNHDDHGHVYYSSVSSSYGTQKLLEKEQHFKTPPTDTLHVVVVSGNTLKPKMNQPQANPDESVDVKNQYILELPASTLSTRTDYNQKVIDFEKQLNSAIHEMDWLPQSSGIHKKNRSAQAIGNGIGCSGGPLCPRPPDANSASVENKELARTFEQYDDDRGVKRDHDQQDRSDDRDMDERDFHVGYPRKRGETLKTYNARVAASEFHDY